MKSSKPTPPAPKAKKAEPKRAYRKFGAAIKDPAERTLARAMKGYVRR